MLIDPSGIRVAGRLEPFAVGFAGELERQGYARSSADSQMRLMAHLCRWLEEEGSDVHEFGATEVERFVSARRAEGYTKYLTSQALRPMLTYLRELGVAPTPPPPSPNGPVEVTLERYRHYLTVERGLASASARAYIDAVRPFVRGRLSPDGRDLDLGQLKLADVTAFVVARCPQQSRSTAQQTVTALRSLLGFLHVEGTIERGLSTAVPKVAAWRLAGLPRGLEPTQVRSLLASCDRRTRRGRRDFAILTTLVRLGLRAGEVAALGLDDIAWRAGEMTVHGKGNRAECLPLPVDVGEAIAAYLRCGRPASAHGRTVFVRLIAPHCGLGRGGVKHVVADAARRTGLEPIHPHRLRHTAATQMLRAGASLPEIGQLLRHRHISTTAIYAKVDREALRILARPWPGGVA